jgi:hypothetical protein
MPNLRPTWLFMVYLSLFPTVGFIYLLWRLGSKTFAIRSFVDYLFLRIAVGETELDCTSGWNIIRELLDEAIDDIIDSIESNVSYLRNNFAFEIGSTIDHHFLGYAEKNVSRLVEILGFSLLALFIAEKDEVDYLGI